MNLLNTFPEIDKFFKRSNFSNADLDKLYNELKRKYIDKRLYNAAESLVKLELMKFELQDLNIKPDNKSNPSTKLKSTKCVKKSEYITYNFPVSIAELAKDLNLGENYLISLFKQHGIKLFNGSAINATEYRILESFINSRKESVIRKLKQDESFELNLKKSSVTKKSSSPGVYGEIEKYGIGKVIYIRKK